jgi:uncharacterized protein
VIAEPAPVSWRRGIAAGALGVVLSTAVYVPAYLAGRLAPASHEKLIRAAVVCSVLAVCTALALVATFWIASRRRRSDLPGFGIALPRRVVSSLAIWLGLAVAGSVLGGILTALAGLQNQPTTEVDTGGKPAGEKLLIAFTATALAPWVEESTFRGLIFTSLMRRFGFWAGATVSSLAWSGLHLALGVLILFTIEGIVLCWLRVRTGSILPGVAVHGTWNCIAAGLTGAGWYAIGSVTVLYAALLAVVLRLRPA